MFGFIQTLLSIARLEQIEIYSVYMYDDTVYPFGIDTTLHNRNKMNSVLATSSIYTWP